MAFNLYYLNDKYTKIYDMIVRKVFSDLNHVPVSTTFVQQFATRLIPEGLGLQHVSGLVQFLLLSSKLMDQ